MMKVEVISREIIKPSSPNPHHLGSYKFNALDRTTAPSFIPLILFYTDNGGSGKHNDQAMEKNQQLKRSLSEILTQFYPLAGRIKDDNCTLEYNDKGAEFSEARVDGQLSEFLQRPSVDLLNQMVSCSLFHVKSGSDVVLAIQLNHFQCGGLAIGISMFHKLGDANSLANFINEWARAARSGGEEIVGPDLNSSALFPVDDLVHTINYSLNDTVVTRRFVFEGSKIAALRSRSTSNGPKAEQPTRYEAVSALIWRCLAKASGEEDPAVSVSLHAVNLRSRTVPLLPEHSFGNFILVSAAATTKEEWERDMGGQQERKIRAAIRKIDNDYVKKLQGPSGVLKHMESLKAESTKYGNGWELVPSYFTSWCRFPFYEADFGWGKPIWVSPCGIPADNLIILLDTRSGDGIEAWVNLENEKMVKFERDQELLSFASFTPGFT